jgi:hypothetical protein
MIAKRVLTMERDCRSILSERAALEPFETTPARRHRCRTT